MLFTIADREEYSQLAIPVDCEGVQSKKVLMRQAVLMTVQGCVRSCIAGALQRSSKVQ